MLIRIARAEAIAARQSTIMICVLWKEEDLGFFEDAINSFEADKESVVTFGPWKAAPSIKDLLDCVKIVHSEHSASHHGEERLFQKLRLLLQSYIHMVVMDVFIEQN